MTRRGSIVLTALVTGVAAVALAWRRLVGLLELIDALDREGPTP